MNGFFDRRQQQIEPLSLEEGLEQFVATYMPARNYAQRTREEYQKDLEDLAEFLNEQGVTSWTVVSLRDLQHYLAELERRRITASSRKRKAYAIKTFFRFLRQAGFLKENPARELIPPAAPDKEPRFLREHEYQALRNAVQEPRDLAIVEIFLQTGIRLSELAALTIHDVELPRNITSDPHDTGFLYVRRGRSRNALPLNWKACEAIAEWLQERQKLADEGKIVGSALFVSRIGTQLTARAIRNLVNKYLEAAGIQNASPRTLRHTMATHYLARGGDLKSVQGMLGVKEKKSVSVYLEMAKKVNAKMVQDLAL